MGNATGIFNLMRNLGGSFGIATAATLGQLLESYTHQTLQRAFSIVGLVALGLGLIGLIGLERRQAGPGPEAATGPGPVHKERISYMISNVFTR